MSQSMEDGEKLNLFSDINKDLILMILLGWFEYFSTAFITGSFEHPNKLLHLKIPRLATSNITKIFIKDICNVLIVSYNFFIFN